MKRFILALLFVFSITSFAYAEQNDLNAKGEIISEQVNWSWITNPNAQYYRVTIFHNDSNTTIRETVYTNGFSHKNFGYGNYNLSLFAYNKDWMTNAPLSVSYVSFQYQKPNPGKLIETPTTNETIMTQPLQEPILLEPLVTYSYLDIENHWAKDTIVTLIGKGIYSSTEKHFYPNQTITRGEFTNILVRSLNLPLSTYKGQFTDVSYSDPNADYIQTAYDNGIVLGTSTTTFEPNKTITRAEISAMFSRTLALKNISITNIKPLTDFKDSSNFPKWATQYIQDVYSAGLVEGKSSLSDVVFDYQSNTTNAENATLILRLLNKLEL